MVFYTTKHINQLIKKEYLTFIARYYMDILENPNKYIKLVEENISNYLGGGYTKLLNSGTTAIQFGLLTLGVKKGDEVILPANTYSATAIAITNLGAKPVFCDINLDNYTLDSKDLVKRISKKTKVIIPVHLYGYACEMDEITKVAEKYNLKILEDASHAFGGIYNGHKIGTIGDIGAFSCHISKNFGTLGNGGIFYTKNKSYFDEINNYIFPDIQNEKILNSGRTPAIIGAFDSIVLLMKLKYVDKIRESNIMLVNQYYSFFDNKDYIISIPKLYGGEQVRNLTCLVNNNKELMRLGLGKVYYDINLSKNHIFSNLKNKKLPNTEYFFKHNFSFNFYYGYKFNL